VTWLFAVVTKSKFPVRHRQGMRRDMKYLSSEVHVSAKCPRLPHLQERVRRDRQDKVCVLVTGSFPSSKRHDDEILSQCEKVFDFCTSAKDSDRGCESVPCFAGNPFSKQTEGFQQTQKSPAPSQLLRLVILTGSDA